MSQSRHSSDRGVLADTHSSREVEKADDARREAQAKKITEGEMRTRRKGMDFDFSDDDEGGGNKRRRWSKKERRKRRLDREDGLDKLGQSSIP